MITPDSIPQNSSWPLGADFYALRSQGIALLQQLASEEWTDYNEHDPGVTILEQLCYGITDVGYRASYPMEDLLANEYGQIDAKGEQAFFTAANIFAVSPVTVNDYRKMLIDNLSVNVKNVWVSLAKKAGTADNTPSVLSISVEKNESNKILTDPALIKNIQSLLSSCRNLCEAPAEIKILKQLKIVVKAIVTIDTDTDKEETLAEILLVTRNILSPPVKLYNLNELLELNLPIEEIFAGPKPVNGIIMEEELKSKQTRIDYNGILKGIMQVTGVLTVEDFAVSDGKTEQTEDSVTGIAIDEDHAAYLDLDKTIENIHLYIKDVKCNINAELVKNIYFGKKDAFKRPYDLKNGKDLLDISLPAGNDRDIENYFSIQNNFPEVYGVGKRGLASSVGALRLAQAKQLKAFLLFFEQILANEFSQIANAKKLFSIDRNLPPAYYYQPLYNVPGISELLKPFTDRLKTNTKPGVAWEIFKKDPKNNYVTGLNDIINTPEENLRRRQLFIDHLLARFNELIFTFKYASDNSFEYAEEDISIKEEILRNYVDISSARACAAFIDKETGLVNLSGLEKKLRILLSINDDALKSVIALVDKYLEEYFGGKSSTVNDENKKEDVRKLIRNQFLSIYGNVLLTGIEDTEKYFSGYNYAMDDSDHAARLKQVIAGDDAGDDTEKLIELITKLANVYNEFERFYLIEHSLLLPNNSEAPADFYPYRISLVFSDFPARFKKKEFQDYVKWQVFQFSPAHIQISILWLSVEFNSFEKLYFSWLNNADPLNTAPAKQLTDFLLSHSYENKGEPSASPL